MHYIELNESPIEHENESIMPLDSHVDAKLYPTLLLLDSRLSGIIDSLCGSLDSLICIISTGPYYNGDLYILSSNFSVKSWSTSS